MGMLSTYKSLSRSKRIIRGAKVRALQAKRLLQWGWNRESFPLLPIVSTEGLEIQHQIVVSANSTQSHPLLERGKQNNLELATMHFNGRRISHDRPFSFWRILGQPTANRGFKFGTEIREGCVIPSLGGGLCLLSGALFRLAAELNWKILERHGHTIQTEDSRTIDATLFWPQVDLRFAPLEGEVVLQTRAKDGKLIVAAYGSKTVSHVKVWRRDVSNTNRVDEPRMGSEILRNRPNGQIEVLGNDSKRLAPNGLKKNCITCNERSCDARKGFLKVLNL